MAEGVILLGHGSRAPEAARALSELARRLELLDGRRVVPASMAMNRPTLSEAVSQLADEGCRSVAVVPLFLYSGIHLKEDLPRILEEERKRRPELELVLARPIGPDPLLDSILLSRLAEAVGVGRANGHGPKTATGARSQGAGLLPNAIEERSLGLVEDALWPSNGLPGDAADEDRGFFPVTDGLELSIGSAPDKDAGREVVKRLVHASGDLGISSLIRMSSGAAEAGVAALRAGCPVVCDVEMVRAGLDAGRLDRLGCQAVCLLSGKGVAEEASARGKTRTALAVGRALALYPQALVLVGNAPTALEEVCDRVESGEAFPPLVIGTPVGFVGAKESKGRLTRVGIPFVTVEGTRGGSALSAAALNALVRLALEDWPEIRRRESVIEEDPVPVGERR